MTSAPKTEPMVGNVERQDGAVAGRGGTIEGRPGAAVQWTRHNRECRGVITEPADSEGTHALTAMGKVFVMQDDDGHEIPCWVNADKLTPLDTPEPASVDSGADNGGDGA